MPILDANAILRYLLNDISDQYKQVEKAISEGAFTTTEVLAEVAYVLKGVYNINRKDISWFLHCILLDVETENKNILQYAMGLYNQTNLDFVDCILIAYNKICNFEILSFDEKLNKNLKKTFHIYQRKNLQDNSL